MAALIFKICTSEEWAEAERNGAYSGSGLDRKDGFIHLSSAETVRDTAALYFADQPNLVLIAVDPEMLKAPLKWEPSRGGQLFPHLFGMLNLDAVAWVKPLPWNADVGAHNFPEMS